MRYLYLSEFAQSRRWSSQRAAGRRQQIHSDRTATLRRPRISGSTLLQYITNVLLVILSFFSVSSSLSLLITSYPELLQVSSLQGVRYFQFAFSRVSASSQLISLLLFCSATRLRTLFNPCAWKEREIYIYIIYIPFNDSSRSYSSR